MGGVVFVEQRAIMALVLGNSATNLDSIFHSGIETNAASYAMRRESIPIQILFEEAVGREINITHNMDNTQAIVAIEKGHPEKLRHLWRTHRCSFGPLHESSVDPGLRMTVKHCPTRNES